MKLERLLLTLIATQLRAVLNTLEELEKGMATNQEKLNQISSDLNEATSNVRSEIDALQQQVAQGGKVEDLDFSGVEDALRQLQGATSAVESGEPQINPLGKNK